MEKPFISFVVTARNDNYGGNWTNRINAFIKVLIYQTNRVSLPCELVFVEYNPPTDKKHIYEELSIADNKFLSIRFITVPHEFHQKLPDHEKVTVCEFIGKNIGMRRSKAEWIVATNPDVLYSNDIFDFFASKKLDAQKFYRINRSDLSTKYIDSKLTAKDILTAAESKVIKILYNDKTAYVSFKEWLQTFIHGRTVKTFLLCPLFNRFKTFETDDSVMHQNAAGDFLLAHRDAWAKVRGYDEITVGSGVLDSYVLYTLFCFNFTQNIIKAPLYHIYHHHKGVVYLASHKKLKEDAERMLKTKIPYKINSDKWGFAECVFEEKKF
jgi:hypothetical protein